MPKEKGRALSRWSLAEIAAQLVTLKVVLGVATSTVWRWFQTEKLKPWRYHNWQHILDPKAFVERAHPALRLYEKAKESLLAGIWVVCVDEKTSIQARELEQTPRAAAPGRPMHISPRYKRHDALQLFAGLSVPDGITYAQGAEHKRFVDFQTFLTQVIIPEALRRGVRVIKLVLDNGSTHAPKQLQDWLHAQIKENHGP
ncbi:MAG: transposase [Anaerolineaceae bacterium]|nr:transposase [Anaerolineaceae bacterium]